MNHAIRTPWPSRQSPVNPTHSPTSNAQEVERQVAQLLKDRRDQALGLSVGGSRCCLRKRRMGRSGWWSTIVVSTRLRSRTVTHYPPSKKHSRNSVAINSSPNSICVQVIIKSRFAKRDKPKDGVYHEERTIRVERATAGLEKRAAIVSSGAWTTSLADRAVAFTAWFTSTTSWCSAERSTSILHSRRWCPRDAPQASPPSAPGEMSFLSEGKIDYLGHAIGADGLHPSGRQGSRRFASFRCRPLWKKPTRSSVSSDGIGGSYPTSLQNRPPDSLRSRIRRRSRRKGILLGERTGGGIRATQVDRYIGSARAGFSRRNCPVCHSRPTLLT